jgi:uncharacterized protein YutE (UPF0331/DUF86 family)
MNNFDMIDRDMIYKRFCKLDEFYEKLVDLQSLSKEEYLSNYKNILSSQRALEFSINICIDIGSHLESVLIGKGPETFVDIFKLLEKEHIITSELSNKMKDMVRFRNKLGHYYMDLDDSIVFSILQNNIDDFLLFKDEIINLIEKKEKS